MDRTFVDAFDSHLGDVPSMISTTMPSFLLEYQQGTQVNQTKHLIEIHLLDGRPLG